MVQKTTSSSPKKSEGRGKLLTSLFVVEAIYLSFELLTTKRGIFDPLSLDDLYILKIIFMVICLIGMLRFKKWAAVGFIIMLAIQDFIVCIGFFLNASMLTNISDQVVYIMWSSLILLLFE